MKLYTFQEIKQDIAQHERLFDIDLDSAPINDYIRFTQKYSEVHPESLSNQQTVSDLKERVLEFLNRGDLICATPNIEVDDSFALNVYELIFDEDGISRSMQMIMKTDDKEEVVRNVFHNPNLTHVVIIHTGIRIVQAFHRALN